MTAAGCTMPPRRSSSSGSRKSRASARSRVGGSSLPGVRVDVNPTQLNSFGLGLEDVRTMLSRQNANQPKGQLANDQTTADLAANDQLLKAEDYKPLIVGYHNGAAIKLSDIANVQDSVENIRAAGFVNGKPSVLLIIFRQPGANIIETVDRVRQALPSLKASIPSAIELTVVMDRTTTIRASVRDVEITLVDLGRPGHPGRVHLPAQRARDPDPQRGRAGVLDRHLRHHVPVPLQH